MVIGPWSLLILYAPWLALFVPSTDITDAFIVLSGLSVFHIWFSSSQCGLWISNALSSSKGKTKKCFRFLRAAGPLTGVIWGTVFVKIFNPSPISVLFGLGVSSIVGSFFSSYPTTGSFSRSAVNNESRAKTGFFGILTGMIMGFALLFLTSLFEDIPQCALAAIAISTVMVLIEYKEAIHLWRVDKKDFLLSTITFIVTLFLGIEIGVLVGTGVSLAFVIHESANPHIAILGRLPGTTIYRNKEQYPEAYTYHGNA